MLEKNQVLEPCQGCLVSKEQVKKYLRQASVEDREEIFSEFLANVHHDYVLLEKLPALISRMSDVLIRRNYYQFKKEDSTESCG
ncbi:hypothetical protein Cri9333_0362 [Crinalium epipsammum PCC 9333]|uniref:Uncharacterized protein n=1 Tax=Crinalium epipsammum PCC 9333 TaxID=1173022 RepID=K9VV29_9CYAN|nr:hypothetical protein [Crinalium epipsammum]AFZ11342.1 hypothetical protein Cri9333_0362 [Crinalium epipsammum PCC 9333]